MATRNTKTFPPPSTLSLARRCRQLVQTCFKCHPSKWSEILRRHTARAEEVLRLTISNPHPLKIAATKTTAQVVSLLARLLLPVRSRCANRPRGGTANWPGTWERWTRLAISIASFGSAILSTMRSACPARPAQPRSELIRNSMRRAATWRRKGLVMTPSTKSRRLCRAWKTNAPRKWMRLRLNRGVWPISRGERDLSKKGGTDLVTMIEPSLSATSRTVGTKSRLYPHGTPTARSKRTCVRTLLS